MKILIYVRQLKNNPLRNAEKESENTTEHGIQIGEPTNRQPDSQNLKQNYHQRERCFRKTKKKVEVIQKFRSRKKLLF
ncbi:MAG: hypothetical protein BWK80_19355 [Desulfobacteraceae bacterium IS3]|nr:MAG: hypothetical protein BWK80_19355 [Desulfobacteraceae bacterium IS3]HAO21803.1 hypothetical protein [Desulfobacteraceae bacterium]